MLRDVLRHEAELLGRLEHPNIARLLGQGATDEGRQFLALEYVEGERIDQYCRSRQLPLASRLRLFLAVLAAVGHAHDRLMIHRDLKPANVLVTRDATVKLVDFGIAKLLCEQQRDVASSDAMSATALTPEYAAPEQLHGEALSPATDVYQLGMLFRALLSNAGAPPQRSGPAKRMEAALIRSARRISHLAQAPLREMLPDGVEAALARALDAGSGSTISNGGCLPSGNCPASHGLLSNSTHAIAERVAPSALQPPRFNTRPGRGRPPHDRSTPPFL